MPQPGATLSQVSEDLDLDSRLAFLRTRRDAAAMQLRHADLEIGQTIGDLLDGGTHSLSSIARMLGISHAHVKTSTRRNAAQAQRHRTHNEVKARLVCDAPLSARAHLVGEARAHAAAQRMDRGSWPACLRLGSAANPTDE